MLLGKSETLGVVGNAVVLLWLVAVSCPVLFPLQQRSSTSQPAQGDLPQLHSSTEALEAPKRP